MKKGIVLLCLVLLLLMLVGCRDKERVSKSEIDSEVTLAQTTEEKELDSNLLGTWIRLIDDYKGAEMTFYSDGSYKFYHPEYNEVLSTGSWETKEGMLILDSRESWEYASLPENKMRLTSSITSTLWAPGTESEVSETEAVKQDEDIPLLGKWRSPGGGILITFNEDGTLRYENIGNPIQMAKWSVNGNSLTLDFSGKITTYFYYLTDDFLYMEADGEGMKWYR